MPREEHEKNQGCFQLQLLCDGTGKALGRKAQNEQEIRTKLGVAALHRTSWNGREQQGITRAAVFDVNQLKDEG